MTDLSGPAALLAASAAVFGPLSGWYAGRRDRHPVAWLAFGALLGPLALVLLAIAPSGRCPSCDEPVRGWPSTCTRCRRPLDGRLSAAWSAARRPAPAVRSARVARTPVASPAPSVRPSPVPSLDTHADRDEAPALPPPIPLHPDRRPRPASTRRPDGSIVAETWMVDWDRGPHAPLEAAEVIATGVYFGGTARLALGSRYAIVRHGTNLRLQGPVDQDPTKLALERSLIGLIVTAMGDRVLVSEGSGDRLALGLALGSFAGASAAAVEEALSLTEDRSSQSWPASR